MDDLNKTIGDFNQRLDYRFNEVMALMKELFPPRKTTIHYFTYTPMLVPTYTSRLVPIYRQFLHPHILLCMFILLLFHKLDRWWRISCSEIASIVEDWDASTYHVISH